LKQNLALDGFTIDDADMETLAALDRGPGLAWSVGDPVATQ
jgi:2,5-diketo-D-gluconate reductase A